MADDLFSEDNELTSSFMKWGQAGDHIVGTLVSTRETDDQYNPGETQKIYDIKVDKGEFHGIDEKKIINDPTTLVAGEVWSVGGKSSIDSQMARIQLGQKVGLKFTEEKPAAQKGHANAKVIKVYTKTPPQMDEEWLAENGLA